MTTDRRAFAELASQEFVVYTAGAVDIGDVSVLQCPTVTIATKEAPLPRAQFEAAGPIGNKLLHAEIEVVDDTHVCVAWTGQTWGLRSAFDAADVELLVEDGAATRFLNGEAGNVGKEDVAAEILDLFVGDVLHKTPCLVRITNLDKAAKASPVKELLRELRAGCNLQFVDN